MLRRWFFELVRLVGCLAVALAFGLWLARPVEGLLVGVGLYLLLVLCQLYRLDRYMNAVQSDRAVKINSVWTQIFNALESLKTEAKANRIRYRWLEREVRQSTGALRDGGIIFNAAKEVQWFNPAATRLLLLDPSRDVGQRLENLIGHPDLLQKLAAPGRETITIPAPQDPAGHLSVQVIPYGAGQRLAVIRDVTRQVKIERMRRDFVANASHELRSPLTVISGYLDALAEAEELPESWQAPISETQRQAERMTTILGDLIELMRLESAEGDAPEEFVDVGTMLDLIRTELTARSDVPHLTLRLEEDLALLGSESELHSIFFNLINNAVRFTSSEGEVRVSWRTVDDGAVFSVVDTGIGIPEEHLSRLTERFYRVDRGRSRATGGTGLGLAIVKHALQRHNGRLVIKSRVNEGSAFSCEFPAPRLTRRDSSNRASV